MKYNMARVRESGQGAAVQALHAKYNPWKRIPGSSSIF
jgi:hypothetical protein